MKENTMAHVVVYSKDYCPHCVATKNLFNSLNVPFDEIDLVQNPEKAPEMVEKSGGRKTVPQTFIDGKHIGGNDDLQALHAEGKLLPLLG